MKSEVVSFRRDCLPNETQTLKERVKAAGRIQEVRIRFYPGQESALRVNPFVLHKGSKSENLVTYAEGTLTYFAGDDDYFVLPCSTLVENDDELCLYYLNNNGSFTYTLAVDIVIIYTDLEV